MKTLKRSIAQIFIHMNLRAVITIIIFNYSALDLVHFHRISKLYRMILSSEQLLSKMKTMFTNRSFFLNKNPFQRGSENYMKPKDHSQVLPAFISQTSQ